MVEIGTEDFFWERVRTLPRPGEENTLAFYDHRLGAIFTNPRLMLIPLDDHLVHRGDGVFEALRFEDGAIYQLDEHIHRLARSAQAINLAFPVSAAELNALVRQVCLASGASAGNALIFLGRGPGGFTLDTRECPSPSLYIVAKRFACKSEAFWEKGVSAVRTRIPAKQGWMSKIKSVNYLPNVLMKMDAVEQGADYPLCFDEEGFLAEGSTENAVLVDHEGFFVVPELKNALTGTTLARAMHLAQQFTPAITRPVPEEELYACREIILLGTSIDAVSVVRYNGRVIGDGQPGPVSRRLRALLVADRRAHAHPLACT
ncbi:MAG: aminodeoxychorismate lyase [Desulfovibrionales bacterium]|nr:aminodeoxychorismate lyase [Desulfovibrionales bacterium]